MESEMPFRISLVIVAVLTMAVTVYHRLQAAKSGEKISHKEEGYLFATVLRLTGLILWISTFGYLIFPACFAYPMTFAEHIAGMTKSIATYKAAKQS